MKTLGMSFCEVVQEFGTLAKSYSATGCYPDIFQETLIKLELLNGMVNRNSTPLNSRKSGGEEFDLK